MIESLVDQIEARFAAVSAQMSDAEVIADRVRYAEVGRSFNQLSAAVKLAEQWRHAKSDAEGAGEMLAEGGDDAPGNLRTLCNCCHALRHWRTDRRAQNMSDVMAATAGK